MIEAVKKEKVKIIDYLGLFFIGLLSLGYVLFYSNFAKLHVNLYFLKAPLFIGDLMFVICFLLLFLKWLLIHKNLNAFTYLGLLYFGFIFAKTIFGYFHWGALSLRHSVLFYYPLFAFFTLSFFRKVFFNPAVILALIFIFVLIFKIFIFYNYFYLTCFLLTLILINAYPKKWLRYILYFLLLAVFPFKFIFDTSRTFITSNLLIIAYISSGFLYILRANRIFKLIFSLLLISFVIYGIRKNANPNELESIVGFRKLNTINNEASKSLNIKEQLFVEQKLDVKLYNKTVFSPVVKNIDSPSRPAAQFHEDKIEKNSSNKQTSKVESVVAPIRVVDNPYANRNVTTPYANSLFRIFIWKDALKELRIKHPVFGFDFGKPFRSRTIEILDWGSSEWSRDGWICIHNSYIDIVYRAGVFGILMVISIFIVLFLLIRRAFQNRSLIGILLTGILINWFIAANFLEILEMPYTAIPLWSLFGLTCAHLFENKEL